MKIILNALVATTLLFVACSKEGSLENSTSVLPGGNGGNGGGATGSRLVQIGSKVGADTITTNFTYDNAGRLTQFRQVGIFSGMPFSAALTFKRNAAGLITSTVNKNDALAQFGLDSVEAFHTYDAANSRYRYSISRITIFGDTETDSTSYTYTSGRLTSATVYTDDGSGYLPVSKVDFSYAGANLSEMKSYEWDDVSNAFVLEKTVTHEYDDKVNPVSFPTDALVTDMEIFYSANNAVKTTTVTTNPASTTVRLVTYTYNNNNRPLTAVSGNGNIVASRNNYIYQ